VYPLSVDSGATLVDRAADVCRELGQLDFEAIPEGDTVTAIGVIGLGNMGRGMALTLKRAGYRVLGFDVMAPVRAALAAEGIETVAAIGAVMEVAEIVILSLPTAEIVETVVAGDSGILAHARAGVAIVDTSTSHPDTTRRLAGLVAAKAMSFVDAPVSGGPKGAITGTMTMVIGGADADVARVMPMLMNIPRSRASGSRRRPARADPPRSW
jgi:3-hydroxyisobutyrate dehydrogenase